jgi:DNA polymerase-4
MINEPRKGSAAFNVGDRPMMPGLCRDCGLLSAVPVEVALGRCPACRSPRRVAHAELTALAIAHIDCDAFYASVEKRDAPALVGRPVIVGGGRRGVVSAACYVARRFGVRSAMPMFKALRACPEAVVIRPDMAKYVAVGREVRRLMLAVTPLVEPLSIDEAFLDMTGTEALHGAPPAAVLSGLARRIEAEVGITVSIGLAPNKFLAKLASDLDKPRGFQVIGAAEAVAFLARLPVEAIWGVGPALRRRLAADGLVTIGDLQRSDPLLLARRYGRTGARLAELAHGRDVRPVTPSRATKSISAETTFDSDLADLDRLERALWPLAEKVARRLDAAGFAAEAVSLKLKTDAFRIVTRHATLTAPTSFPHRLFREARRLLEREATGARYRLIGIGAERLVAANTDATPDLFDADGARGDRLDRALAAVRSRHGVEAAAFGRSLDARDGRMGGDDLNSPDRPAPPRT